nr:hypothetical protein [Oscillospiraceae bacterium]
MRIRIQWQEHILQIALPTGWLLSPLALRLASNQIALNEKRIEGLSRKSAEILSAELKRIRKIHGDWVLVEVQSAGGETVTVTL